MATEMTLDLDETIAQVRQISEGLVEYYPSWTDKARTALAAQLLQVALQQENLRYLIGLEDKVQGIR